MQQPVRKYHTREEYLAMEEAAEYKSEYYRGEIFAMAGASLDHNRIAIDFCTLLNRILLPRNCEGFAENVKIWIKAADLFTYPDVVVVCGKPELYEDRVDTITNPVIIVEVLSEATELYDRGRKFEFYRTLPSLREYVLVDQRRMHVEQFTRNDAGKWVLAEYHGADTVLPFASVKAEIVLKDIYARVKFEPAS